MTKKITIVAAILILAALFWALDLSQYLTLEYFKTQKAALEALRNAHPILFPSVFFLVYVAMCALSIPGATVLTLAAGAIFGLGWGTLLVSFASSVGATLAFWVSRYLLRDWVQARYARNLQAVNEGIAKDGAFYLFTLRLLPIFPFFLINLIMGLTRLPAWTFYWVSQAGMLAATLVYVNAGTELGKLESLSGILSPQLLGAFILLGLFPLIAKKLLAIVRGRLNEPRAAQKI